MSEQQMQVMMAMDELNEEGGELLQLVSFHVGDEEFAIDILGVQEIIRMVELTPVPNAPYFVEGVINLRGKVIPILDLRSRFGLPPAERTIDTRIIVVEIEKTVLGFVVDSVEEVLRLPESLIETPPSTGRGGSAEFHKGVGRVNGRLLMLLDLGQILGVGTGS
ncbi:MAG: chemotaxis protein CheW [Nitrospirales bacterium]|nr:MAG: chemotaxis protein CheW [Nitrospirales bacterium]